MGPSAIRYAGLKQRLELLGHDVADLGDLHLPRVELQVIGDPRLKHLQGCLDAAEKLARAVRGARLDGRLPIALGGDHSLALGSVATASRSRSSGLLWVDAHADFNTADTSPSGNIHGMPLAALCGLGDRRLVDVGRPGPKVDPARVALVGVRSIDHGERQLLLDAGVSVFTTHDIDRRGLSGVMAAALEVVTSGDGTFHVSFDLDVLDPRQAPGVGTPVAGGLTYREAHLLMEMVAETDGMSSLDLVEVNPILDHRNVTAQLAAELACSALGQSIF